MRKVWYDRFMNSFTRFAYTHLPTLAGATYRGVSRLLHKFDLHYMPPCYPDRDTLYRCAWCGISHIDKYSISTKFLAK